MRFKIGDCVSLAWRRTDNENDELIIDILYPPYYTTFVLYSIAYGVREEHIDPQFTHNVFRILNKDGLANTLKKGYEIYKLTEIIEM